MAKKNLPKRKSIRLKNYDYTSVGCYFVTICTHNRKCLFGKIVGNKMVLNGIGKMIKNIWKSLPNHHSVKLNVFQIMPNHVHSIIQIVDASVGATRGSPAVNRSNNPGGSQPNNPDGSRPAPTGLGTIVGLFKSECTKQIRRILKKPNIVVWQRNYYENIIRNENDLNKIRQYIKINPEMPAPLIS